MKNNNLIKLLINLFLFIFFIIVIMAMPSQSSATDYPGGMLIVTSSDSPITVDCWLQENPQPDLQVGLSFPQNLYLGGYICYPDTPADPYTQLGYGFQEVHNSIGTFDSGTELIFYASSSSPERISEYFFGVTGPPERQYGGVATIATCDSDTFKITFVADSAPYHPYLVFYVSGPLTVSVGDSSPVPEPASFLLLGSGFLGLVG